MLIYLVCFVLFAAFHLYACYFHIEKLRMLTKPMLLLALAMFYALYAANMRATVLIALLCGMVGDILLLWPNETRYFMTGAFVFSAGHALYSYVLVSRLITRGAAVSPWLVALVALPFAAEAVTASLKLAPNVKKRYMHLLMPMYLGLVGVVNVLSWLTLIDALKTCEGGFAAALLTLGGLLFLVSDTVLCVGVFKREKPRTNFYVMLTYIAAQLCLCLGFMKLN